MVELWYLAQQPGVVFIDGHLGVAGGGQVRLQLQYGGPLGLGALRLRRGAATPFYTRLAAGETEFRGSSA